MDARSEIAYSLISLMEETGTKGKDLADAIGVSKQAVSNWRNGKSSIDIDNVPRICEYFGITADEFFSRADAAGDDERELLRIFRAADPKSREVILKVARAMEEQK